MIFNAGLFAIHGFLSFVSGLLGNSTVTANDSILGAVTTANGYIAAVQDFLPNGPILAATAFLLVFEASYGAYKIVRWAYRKIPGIT
jgi:hypothetical protein